MNYDIDPGGGGDYTDPNWGGGSNLPNPLTGANMQQYIDAISGYIETGTMDANMPYENWEAIYKRQEEGTLDEFLKSWGIEGDHPIKPLDPTMWAAKEDLYGEQLEGIELDRQTYVGDLNKLLFQREGTQTDFGTEWKNYRSTLDTVYTESGMAKTGGVLEYLDQAKDSLLGDYGEKMKTSAINIAGKERDIGPGLETRADTARITLEDFIAGEKDTQLDKFYTDIRTALESESADDGGGGGGGTCVLSTAAYKQGLISSSQMMQFVSWRLKTQHKEFLGNVKWLGYQMTWKPVANLMLKNKRFAKLIKRFILDKWINVIKGKKSHRITKFFVEYTSVIGFALNYSKCMKLAAKFKSNPRFILDEYRNIITKIDGTDKAYKNFKRNMKD